MLPSLSLLNEENEINIKCIRQFILIQIQSITDILIGNTYHNITDNKESNNQINFITQLTSLRSNIESSNDKNKFNFQDLFHPFLIIIKSEDTTYRETGSALSIINNFLRHFQYQLTSSLATTTESLADIIESIIQCRFQATDPNKDQIVLLLVVELLEATLKCPAAETLTDDLLWQATEMLYNMSQSNITPTAIRFHASNVLHNLVTTYFNQTKIQKSRHSRLPLKIKTLAFLSKNLNDKNREETILALNLINSCLMAAKTEIITVPSLIDIVKDDICRSVIKYGRLKQEKCFGLENKDEEININLNLSCLNIIRMLWSNLRVVLKIQFEAIFNNIFFPSLHWIAMSIKNNFLSKTSETQQLTSEDGYDNNSLQRVSFNILQCLCDLLTIEPFIPLELHVNYDSDEKSTDITENLFELYQKIIGEIRQLQFQMLSPDNESFPVEVTNITKLDPLNQHDSQWIENLQSLIFRSLHNLLYALNIRSKIHTHTSNIQFISSINVPSAEQLKRKRDRKKLLKIGSAKFNNKAKNGLLFLQEHDLLSTPLTPESVARYLRSLPSGLEKKAVGAYLGSIGKKADIESSSDVQPDKRKTQKDSFFYGETIEFHEKVLKCFVESFNFSGQSFIDSLRMFLSTFYLPGEAQQIDRILSSFAQQTFLLCNDKYLFSSSDVCYLLSFSVIMLNTDLHNSNIKKEKKMSLDDFIRNNINYGTDVSTDGNNLPPEFLEKIYVSISNQEIQTRDDTGSMAEITDDRWKDLLGQVENDLKDGNFIVIELRNETSESALESEYVSDKNKHKDKEVQTLNSLEYERYVFKALFPLFRDCFKIFLDALKDTVSDGNLQVVVNGLQLMASISSNFDLTDEFNEIYIILSSYVISFLDKYSTTKSNKNEAQLSFLALDNILSLTNDYVSDILEGWHFFFLMLCKLRERDIKILHHNTSLSILLLDSDEKNSFIAETKRVGLIKLTTNNNSNKKLANSSNTSNSFFGTLTSFFSSTTGVAASKNAIATNSPKVLLPSNPSKDLVSDVDDIAYRRNSIGEELVEIEENAANKYIITKIKKIIIQTNDSLENSNKIEKILFGKTVGLNYKNICFILKSVISKVEQIVLPANSVICSNNMKNKNLEKSHSDISFWKDDLMLQLNNANNSISASTAIFLEHLISELILKTIIKKKEYDAISNKDIMTIVIDHCKILLTALPPVIQGNLVINNKLSYTNACFLLDTMFSGLFSILSHLNDGDMKKNGETTFNYFFTKILLLLSEMEYSFIFPFFLQIIRGIKILLVGSFTNDSYYYAMLTDNWQFILRLLKYAAVSEDYKISNEGFAILDVIVNGITKAKDPNKLFVFPASEEFINLLFSFIRNYSKSNMEKINPSLYIELLGKIYSFIYSSHSDSTSNNVEDDCLKMLGAFFYCFYFDLNIKKAVVKELMKLLVNKEMIFTGFIQDRILAFSIIPLIMKQIKSDFYKKNNIIFINSDGNESNEKSEKVIKYHLDYFRKKYKKNMKPSEINICYDNHIVLFLFDILENFYISNIVYLKRVRTFQQTWFLLVDLLIQYLLFVDCNNNISSAIQASPNNYVHAELKSKILQVFKNIFRKIIHEKITDDKPNGEIEAIWNITLDKVRLDLSVECVDILEHTIFNYKEDVTTVSSIECTTTI